jgi:hypothetical protein
LFYFQRDHVTQGKFRREMTHYEGQEGKLRV